MRRLDEYGRANRWAKRAAPLLARTLVRTRLLEPSRLVGHYLDILQGLGSGTGWDLHSETATAIAVIEAHAPVIVDVGANRGRWAAEMERRLRPRRSRFFLIEPAPACEAALRGLGIADAVVIRAAAGDAPGTSELLSDRPGSEIASLHRRRDSYFQSHEFTQELVPVVTIDQVMADHGLQTIDFMKIDAEGHDLAVLSGARSALEAHRIGTLSFEFGSAQINSRTFFHDFWDLLHPLGYELRRVCPGERSIAIHGYYEDLEHFRGVSNYLAIAPRGAPTT